MERTISVTGSATVTCPAEITVVNTVVNGKEETFKDAIIKMAETTGQLKDAIEVAGLPRSSLKTSSLNVRQAYRKRKIGQDRYGNDKFEDIPDGFEYSQNVSFEFENDNEILSKAVSNIVDKGITPKIWFGFKTRDQNAFKIRALSEATKNARSEAEAIVSALGAKLGRIVSINHDKRFDFEYNDDSEICMNRCIGSCESMTIDVDPEDISGTQKVSVVWEIEY